MAGEAHCGDPLKPPSQKESDDGVVRISGKEFGEGLDFKQLRAMAKKYAVEHFAGTTVIIESTGNPVRISVSSIKHTLSFARSQEDIYPVVAMPKLLRRSMKIGEETDKYGRHNIKSIE